MKYLERSIMIIGEIGSGKTTIAKHLSKVVDYSVVSFGEFLKHISPKPYDRTLLQDLGEKLIESNPQKFLEDVINYMGQNQNSLIFDGVRHLSIFNAIKECSKECYSIFLDASFEQRRTRYFMRSKDMDVSKEEKIFYEVSNHKVEHETILLKKLTNHIIKSSDDLITDLSIAEATLLTLLS